MAGIKGESAAKEISFSLPFVKKDLTATLYMEGNINRTFSKSDVKLKKGNNTTIVIKPMGGFVMTFQE